MSTTAQPITVDTPDEPVEPTPVAQEAQKESQLEDIEQQVAHREWRVQGDVEIVNRRSGNVEKHTFDKTYMQKPLSFTAMLQFTGLIGEKVSQAMSGPEGLTLDGVIGDAQGFGDASSLLMREDFAGVDAFVKGLAKLAMYVPDVVEDCQCIWLRVPIAERLIVKEIWSRSPEDGGLSHSDGAEMLELFLEQNYQEVQDFFVVRLRRIVEMVAKLRAKSSSENDSPLSKLLRPTQRPIRSQ